MWCLPGRGILSGFLAALVLATVTAPPVLRHRHVGGEVPHLHGSHGSAATTANHEHGGHHGHSHAHHESHSLPVELAHHSHARWFGFEFHLPGLPAEEEHDGDWRLAEARLVRLTDETLIGPTSWSPIGLVDSGTFAASAWQISAQDIQRIVARTSPSLLPSQLCDVARHERSGVQLA